jgi:phage portal protein BeeE
LIALTQDTPPQLLGIPGDSTFVNFEQAQLYFWENTVLQELDAVLEYLNAWLLPMHGANLRLTFDEDSIRALEPKRELMFKRAEKADFLTINEKRQMVGFDEVEGGDIVLQPQNMMPLDMVGAELTPDPAADPSAAEDGQEEGEDEEASRPEAV